jgi:hypothetical protein
MGRAFSPDGRGPALCRRCREELAAERPIALG